MARLSKITTKTGDTGNTGLADGSRLEKHHKRIHLLGELDELNSHIGLSLSYLKKESQFYKPLLQLQHDLFDLGAEICQPGKTLISEEYCEALERHMTLMNDQLAPLKEFILPSGSTLIAQLHLTRAVCRRCERTASELLQSINPISFRYLNRLSDYLFVMSRAIAKEHNLIETYWQSTYSRI